MTGIRATVAGLSLLALLAPISPAGDGPLAHAAHAADSDTAPLDTEGEDACADVPRDFFVDVPDSATAAGSVDCLVWYEIVQGVTYERFAPTEALRRDEIASLLDRVTSATVGGFQDFSASVFDDVDGVHAPAVERLAAAGIVKGRTATRFVPELAVRRDQLAALATRLYAHLTDAEVPLGTHGFGDIAGNTHAEAINRAATLGLVGGVTDTTFEPQRPATRAQASMILARLLQRLVADAPGVSLDTAVGYESRIQTIPASLRQDMERWTWRDGCPVAPQDLRLLDLVHHDMAGVERWGRIVLHHDVADDVAQAFGALHAMDFPIARIEPIERYEGDDDASMEANNTSGFNCRTTTGGTSFSEHSYGRAIDINPVQNPYVRGTTVLPAGGEAYLDRTVVRRGMLARPGPVEAFEAIGWSWGGDWQSLRDYQHLSQTGR